MQPQQHSHGGPGDLLAEQIAQIATSPSVQAASSAIIFRNMGRVLQTAADSFLSINPAEFLTVPRKLVKGNCLALLNRKLALPGAWTLLADNPGGEYTYTLFEANDDNLVQSKIAAIEGDDKIELIRQLQAIGHTGPRLYTLLNITQVIEGYEYFQTDLEKAELQAQAAQALVEKARRDSQAGPATTMVRDVAPAADPNPLEKERKEEPAEVSEVLPPQ